MKENMFVKFGGNAVIESVADDQLGTRGKQLAELASLKAHISAGFVIGSDSLVDLLKLGREKFQEAISPAINHVEEGMKQKFSGEDEPLLIKVVENSVLSFVDTASSTHNIGLNDTTIEAFCKNVSSEFAWREYGNVVRKVLQLKLIVKTDKATKGTTEVVIKALKKAKTIKAIRTAIDGARPILPPRFFSDVYVQLSEILKMYKSIFASTETSSDSSVVVQAMLFGNYHGGDGGFGTMSTRDYITGENPISGSYFKGAFNAVDRSKEYPLKKMNQEHYATLQKLADTLESHFKEIRKVNFTVSNGVLWIMDQQVVTQQTAIAEMKTLLDLQRKKVVDKKYVVKTISASRVSELLHPTLDINSVQKNKHVTGGISGAVGAATGIVYFSAQSLMEAHRKAQLHGEEASCILAMPSTFAEDVKAIEIGDGVISSDGGYASHAPVVARSLGKVAMVNPDIKFKGTSMTVGDMTIREGDCITMNVPYAANPTIYIGKGMLIKQNPQKSGILDLIAMMDEFIDYPVVRANADQPKDAEVAKMFGAQGIGLCRTEHMFFNEKRIDLFRSMIIASDVSERLKVLKQLEKMQINDFYRLFKIMGKLPVSIRLLDAPLHEFLPSSPKSMSDFATFYRKQHPKISAEAIKDRCDLLGEFNPMLGHRGVRLAFTYPEIYKMQIRAILIAAYKIRKEDGLSIVPEIMVPLIMSAAELKAIRNGKKIEGKSLVGIVGIDAEVRKELKISSSLTYKVGTMIELPAAALLADKIAAYAEFFSFGTNDLTQTTHGLSRDDFSNFFSDYNEFDLLESNPFQVLAPPVCELIDIAVRRGRLTRPGLKVGLCGEHGADPANTEFMIQAGLDYVSCSPYGIPIAKLALAQYNLKHKVK